MCDALVNSNLVHLIAPPSEAQLDRYAPDNFKARQPTSTTTQIAKGWCNSIALMSLVADFYRKWTPVKHRPGTIPAPCLVQRPMQMTGQYALKAAGEAGWRHRRRYSSTNTQRLSAWRPNGALTSPPLQRCQQASQHSGLGSGRKDGTGRGQAAPQRADCRRRQAGALADVQMGQPMQRCQLEQCLIVQLHTAFQLQPPQACGVRMTPVRWGPGFTQTVPETTLTLLLCSQAPQVSSRATQDPARVLGAAWQEELVCDDRCN